MQEKVLIISSDYFGYHNSVARGFAKLGFETKVETYDEPIHPFKGVLKWRHKFAFDKESLRQKSRNTYNNYIKDIYDNYKPNIVFMFNATILEKSTLDYFKQGGTKLILWMYDSVLHPDRIRGINHIDAVDLMCCFEQKDVDYYAQKGKVAHFLPMASDTSVYYPIKILQKDIDILFVGVIYTSAKRVEILEKLATRYKDKKLCFYGYYKPYFKDPLGFITMKNRDIFKNLNIQPHQVNELYSRTKIALNIHSGQTFNGANPRLFEASGAGAYQICDSNPYIASIFKNGEVGLYDNFDKLCELIDFALANDMSEKALAARQIVEQEHIFDKRVEQILGLLG
ncbi:MAG: glycosyltransferase [bacterium]